MGWDDLPFDLAVAGVLAPFKDKGWQVDEEPVDNKWVNIHCPRCSYFRTVLLYPAKVTYPAKLADCLTKHETLCVLRGGED